MSTPTMKFAPLAALLLIAGASTPALADGHTESSEAAVAFTINTPIEVLMADEAAKAVVLAHLPGIDNHPAYGQFKGMSLVELKPWSQGMITDQTLEDVAEGLATLG
ncbi:MAG: hypothetical protein ABJN35_12670 [Erythrobacter sp.]